MKNNIEKIRIAENLLLKQPQDTLNCEYLANLYENVKNWKVESSLYNQKEKHGLVSNAFFNAAYRAKELNRFKEAIQLYRLTLDYNVSEPEEVHVNLAVIYSENLRLEHKAEIELKEALVKKNQYPPALYNLAGLYEEIGNREGAIELYEALLVILPHNADVLSRLALCFKGEESKALIEPIKIALQFEGINLNDKINLQYTLGKLNDDVGNYQLAFKAYEKANQLEKQNKSSYQKNMQEKFFDENKILFNENWFKNLPVISTEKTIFICGMYRSGSTLLEQILSSHTDITAGGEIEFFNKLTNYPQEIKNKGTNELKQLAQQYIKQLKTLFPNKGLITNKRPDTFLYIGIIKTLFPNAQILHTRRELMDNCLSIYFQRLDDHINYSTDLENIYHFYQKHTDMIEHWKKLFPDSFHIINYEDLVKDIKGTTSGLFKALNIDWQEECLNFHQNVNSVKTASIWQVRDRLHQRSKGRWNNYSVEIKAALKNVL